MLAVMEGHAQVVRMLIDAHANLEAVDKYGFGNVRARVNDGLTFDFVASLKQHIADVGDDGRSRTNCSHVDRRECQTGSSEQRWVRFEIECLMCFVDILDYSECQLCVGQSTMNISTSCTCLPR